MANMNIEETQEQARKLLNSRIESVTALAKARQRVADLQEQLVEADREDKKAYVRATKDGWSPEELKKLGLESAVAGRRRKAASRTTTTNPPTPPHGDPLERPLSRYSRG